MVTSNGVQWRRDQLASWLISYSKFEALLLLRAEMLGGAPGRGTEMSSMLYRNTKTRSQRNLVLIGHYVVLLRLYHKSGALTGTDKLIPHALDSFTGSLLIQDLILARPMAEIIASVLFPHNPDIIQLYHTRLFVKNGQGFGTEDISRIMETYSLNHLGCRLTVNSWRHVNIAWRRKLHSTFMQYLDDMNGGESIQALQSGHSTHIENHIYGRSPDALAGLPEDILPLFLKSSVEWQQTCKTVPGKIYLLFFELFTFTYIYIYRWAQAFLPAESLEI